MNSEKEFDDLFRQRFNESQIPVDLDNWNMAREKLDIHYKKKRRRVIAFWFSGVGILLLIGFISYKTQEYISRKDVPSKKISTSVAPEVIQPNLKNGLNDKINQYKNLAKTRNLFNENKNNVIKKALSSKLKLVAPGKSSLIKSKPDVVESSTVILQSPVHSNETETITTGVTSANETIQNGITDSIYADSNITNVVSVLVTVLTDSVIISTVPDSISIQQDTVLIKEFKQSYSHFGFLAGAVFSPSFKSEFTTKTDVALNYAVGGYFTYDINRKYKVELNVIFFEKSKVNRSKDFTSYHYGQTQSSQTEYGSYIENINISAKTLQYLSFPLLIKYQFGNKHIIETGASYEYLLNSKNSVTTSIYKNGILENVSSTKTTGYINGFNRHDFGLIAGYSCNIYKNLNAFTRLHYGLTDVSKNNYFNFVSIDRTTSVLVGLKIQILNIK